MEENSVGETERTREDDDSDTAMSVASNAENAESFRKKCEDLWDETESKGKEGRSRSRSNSRSKSRASSRRSKSSSRSRSVSRSRSRSVSSRSSRSFSSKSSGKSRTSSRSSIKSRSSVISRSSSKSMSDKNCEVTGNETNCAEKEKEESVKICDKGGVDDSKKQAGGERENGPVHKDTESIHLETESVHLEDNSGLEEGNEESCSVEDLKIGQSGPSLIDTFDVKDGPPDPHYDVEEDEQTFPNLNPMDYVTKEDDDPECPKDIEIPYDDREAMLDHKKDGEAVRAALESLGDQVVGGTLSFGQKMLEVRMPNFKYKAKHLNKSGGFPLAKLKSSHPSFFMKQTKQNVKKPEKLVSAKSTGGGFSAKVVHKPTDTDDEDVELKKKLKEMDDKNAKKQQKIFKEDKILSSKHKSKAKVSSDSSSSDSDVDVKTPEYETAPPLQQVKIKDLEIRVERMEKTLVEEKHKLFMEVEERELKLKQEKEKEAADKKAAKETAKTKKAEVKNDDKKSNDNSAKLANKYNVSLSTSEESNDSDSKVDAPKLETNSKKKVLTKKKPRKSKSTSSDESDDESKSSKELFTNPFFVNDDSEGGTKKISEETEKEKLVEMLYSLIKKDNSDKSTPESSPTKPKEKLPAVNKKDEKVDLKKNKVVKDLSDIKSEDEKPEKPTLDSQESLEKKNSQKSASKGKTVSAKINDKSDTEVKLLSDKKSVDKPISGNAKNFLDLLSDSDSDSDAKESKDNLTIVSEKKGEKSEKDVKEVKKDSDSDSDSDVPSKTVSRRPSKEETSISTKKTPKSEKDVKEVKKDSDSDSDSDVPSKTVSRRPSKEETSISSKKIPKKASKGEKSEDMKEVKKDSDSDSDVPSKTVSRRPSKEKSSISSKKTPKKASKQKEVDNNSDDEINPSPVSSRKSSKDTSDLKKIPKQTTKQKGKRGKDMIEVKKDSDSEVDVPSSVSSRRSSKEDTSIASKKTPKKTSKLKGKTGKDLKETKKDSDSEAIVPSPVSSRRSSIEDGSISSKKTPKKTSKQKGKIGKDLEETKKDSDSDANAPSPVSSRKSSIDDASISSKKTPKKTSKQKGKTGKDHNLTKKDSDSEANAPSPVSSRKSSIDDASISSKKTPKKVSKQKNNKSAFDNLFDGKSSGKEKIKGSTGNSVLDKVQEIIADLEDSDSGGDGGGFDDDDELPNVGGDEVPLDDISTPTIRQNPQKMTNLESSFLNTSLLDSTEDLHVFRDILKLEVGDATDLDMSADIDFAQFETIVLNAIEKLETESLPSHDEEDEDESVIKKENEVFSEQFNLRNARVNVERVHNNEKQMDTYKKALNFYQEWKTNANNLQNWDRKKKRESLIIGLQKIKEKHLVIKETPMKSSDVVASSTPKVCKMQSILSDSDSDTNAKKRKKSSDDSDSEGEKTRRKKIKEDNGKESDAKKDKEKKTTLRENEEKKTIVKVDDKEETKVNEDEKMDSNVKEDEEMQSKSSDDSDLEDEKTRRKKIKKDNSKDSDIKKDKEKESTLKENEEKKKGDDKEETKVNEDKEKEASVKDDEEIDLKLGEDEEKKIELKEKEIEVKENKEIEVNKDKETEVKKVELKEVEATQDENKETLAKEGESEVIENDIKEVELKEDEGKEIKVKKDEKNSEETREAEIEQKSKLEEEEKEGKRKKQEKSEQKKKEEEDVEQKKKKVEEENETKRKREEEEAEKKKKKEGKEKDKEKERERKRAKDKEERKKAKEEERRKEKEKEKKKKEDKYKQMDMKTILAEGSKAATVGTPSSGSKSHNKHNRHEDKRKEDRMKIKEKLKISSDKFVSSAPGPDLMSNILGRMETERKKNKKKTEKELQKELIENHKKRLEDNNYVRDKGIDVTIEPEKAEVDIDSNKINNPNSVLSEQEKAVICKAQNVSELPEPVIDSGKVDEDVVNSPQDFGGMDDGGMADDDDDGDDFDLDLPAPVPAVLADSSAPVQSDRERPSSQLDSRPATLQDKVVDDLTSDDWGVRPGSSGGRSGSGGSRPGSSLGRPGSRNDSEPGDVFSSLPDPARNRPPTPPPPSVVIPPINLNLSDKTTSRIHDHGRGLSRRSPIHEETRRRRTSGYEEHQSRRSFAYEGSQSRRISGYEDSRNRRSMSPTGRDLEDDLSRSPFMEPDSFGGPRTPVAEFTGPTVGPRTPLGEPPKTPAGDTPPHREASPAPDLPDDYPDDYHSDVSCSPSPPMKIPSRSPSPRVKESSRPPSPFLKPSRSPSPFLKNEKPGSLKADRNSKPAKVSSRSEPPAPVPPPPPPPTEPDVPKPVPPPIPFEPKAGVKLPSDIDERFAKHFKEKREENKRKKEEEKKKRDEEKRKKESEKKKREDKGRAVAREALQKQRSKAAAENEAYEPSASPLWEARKKSKTDKPAKPKEFDDFDIDTSKSFLDGGKCIPVENVKKVVSEDAAPEKEIAAKLAGAGLGSFLDKIIKGLAKANQNVNNPPLPKKPPPPPPKEAPPPLPVGKPPPLPSEPHPGRKSSKVQHPREMVEDSISVLNVGEDDFDDNMILNIVAELDDSLAEEEKLKKAKEKLTNILLKKKKESLKAWQGNAKGAQGKKMVMELPGSKPDKSTMGSKPNKSTTKGQLAQYPALLAEKPPPPPNKSNLTEHDIDSFMTDWGMAESEKANSKKVDESETDSNVGSYSSALAKLRAKKLQQAEEPKPLSNALQKLRRLKSDDGFKRGHGDEVEEDGLRRIKSEDAFNRGHGNDKEQDNYRRVKSEEGLKRGHGSDKGSEADAKRGRRDDGGEGYNESVMEPVDDYYNPSEVGSTISGDQGWENHGRDWGQSSASWYGDQSGGRWSNSKTSDQTSNEGAYAAYGANYGYYGAHNQPYVQHPNQVAYGSQRGGTYKYLQNQQYGHQEDSYSQHAGYYNGQYGQRGEQYDPNTGAPWVRTPQMGEYPSSASRGRKSTTWGNEQFPHQGFQSWPGMENTSNSRDSHSRDQTSQSKNGSLTNVQNSSQGVQFGTPGSGEIKEKNYLEKFMFEWDKVLNEDFTRLRHEVDNEIKRQKRKKGDLGSEYDDDRLNMMVKKKNDPQAVEINIIKKTVSFDVTHLQCQVCNISVYGKRNLDTHLVGKRHEGNMADFVISEPPPPLVPISPSSSVLKHLVKRYKSAALLGLEYVAEVLGDQLDAEYHCLLCDQTSTPQNLMYHLLSVKHRLKYLSLYFKVVGRKFNRVKNVDFWEESSFDLLDTVTSRIEEKYGRGEPTVVASPTIFHKDVAKIRQQMKDAKHIRESIDFNFKTLPDPFGTYQFKIPPEEITELTK